MARTNLTACFIAVSLSLLQPVFAGELQDEVRHHRGDLNKWLTNAKHYIPKMRQGHALNVEAHPDTAHTPAGFEDFLTENTDLIKQALAAIAHDKPMTLEAITAYKRAVVESGAMDSLGLLVTLLNIPPHRTPTPPSVGITRLVYLLDENLDLKPGTASPLTLRDAIPYADRLAEIRYPLPEVRFKIGSVTMESEPLDDVLAEIDEQVFQIEQRLLELEQQMRGAARTLTEATESFAAEEKRVGAELKAKFAQLPDDWLQINAAKSASERELAGATAAMRAASERVEDLRSKILEETAKLTALGKKEREAISKMFPNLMRIETNDALLIASDRADDRLKQIDDLIDALHAEMKLTKSMRDRQMKRVLEVAEQVAAAEHDVLVAATKSYIVQACVQALVQIVDAAINSRGNPYAFVAEAGISSVANITYGWPTFYDARLPNAGVVGPTNAEAMELMVDSTRTTGLKSVAGEFVQASGRVGTAQSAELLHETPALLRARKGLTNILSKLQRDPPKAKSLAEMKNIVTGVILDAVTEGAKKKIAEEMQQDALLSLAAQNLLLGKEIDALRTLGLMEEEDEKLLAKLKVMRDDAVRGRARAGLRRAERTPGLEYSTNNLFEVKKGYVLRVGFDNIVEKLEIQVNGAALDKDRAPGSYLVSDAVITKLAEGAEIPLNIHMIFRR